MLNYYCTYVCAHICMPIVALAVYDEKLAIGEICMRQTHTELLSPSRYTAGSISNDLAKIQSFTTQCKIGIRSLRGA